MEDLRAAKVVAGITSVIALSEALECKVVILNAAFGRAGGKKSITGSETLITRLMCMLTYTLTYTFYRNQQIHVIGCGWGRGVLGLTYIAMLDEQEYFSILLHAS